MRSAVVFVSVQAVVLQAVEKVGSVKLGRPDFAPFVVWVRLLRRAVEVGVLGLPAERVSVRWVMVVIPCLL